MGASATIALNINATDARNQIQKVGDGIRQLAREAKEFAKSFGSAFKESFKANFVNSFKNSINKASNSLKNMNRHARTSANTLGKLKARLMNFAGVAVIFHALRRIFRDFINGVKEALQAFASYSADYNSAMSELTNSTSEFKGNLASAFAPIIEIVVPYLVTMINYLNQAANAVAAFFSALSGKSTFSKAIKQNKDYASSLNEAASAAKKTVASFDQLNRLNDNSSSGSSSSSDYEWEEVEIPSWISDLSELFKAGDWGAIGAYLADAIVSGLNSIDWAVIQETASNIAKNLASFLNSTLGNSELWKSIGHTVAQALNTAFIAARDFFEELDGYQIGTAIGDGINQFFEEIQPSDLAAALNAFVDTIKAAIKGIVDETDWKLVFGKIWEFLSSLELDTLTIIVGAIAWKAGGGAAIGALASKGLSLIMGALGTTAGITFAAGVVAAVVGWNIGQKLNEAITGEDIDMSFFEQLEYIKGSFADGSWKDALALWGQDIYDGFYALGEYEDELIEPVKEKLGGWCDDVRETFEEHWTSISSDISGWWNGKMVPWWTSNIAPWFTKEKWEELGGNIRNSLEDSWTTMKANVTDIWDDITANIQKAIDKIKGFLDFDWEWPDIKTPHLSWESGGVTATGWIKEILEALSLPTSLPKLSVSWYANGGFPEDGFFFANSSELVGQFSNGQNVVANNEQIISGISQGVYQAVTAAMANGSGGNQNVTVAIDGKAVFSAVVAENNRQIARTGASPMRV